MLCRLTREQVSRLTLPLGAFEKKQVRALAEEYGLPAAHKKDSMEICFIPDRDYVGWLSQRAALPGPGDFLFHGAAIGRHEGIVRWTVGQRVPGLYAGRKLYGKPVRRDGSVHQDARSCHHEASMPNWYPPVRSRQSHASH